MKTALLLLTMIPSMFGMTTTNGGSSKSSFMSDKTEILVDLEVSGAEALCQTDDGYVWIAQYSGLTRYDSKEYVTYKNFTENGVDYSIINVRALASKENTLYVGTYKNLFIYKDHQFSLAPVETGTIRDMTFDEDNELLYICSVDQGATLYNVKENTSSKLPHLETGNVNDIALDTARGTYYYHLDDGVYDKDGNSVYSYPEIFDVYSHEDILYIGQRDGVIKRYNMSSKTFLDDIVVNDQINKMLYSDKEDILFVACEKNGFYCVDLSNEEPVISLAGDIENKSQLVDLMIDYEGNLWIASHSSGVSIITKNQLTSLLYDDVTWKNLTENKRIYALEKYNDIIYIMSAKHIYLYDVKTNKILPDGVIMEAINNYAGEKVYTPRDVEVFKNKVYFAIDGVGLVEYNPTNNSVSIYGVDYVTDHTDKLIGDPSIALADTPRSLRAFDNYLAIGYGRGVMKFDGEKFSMMQTGNSGVLYISKSSTGKLMFNRTAGIFEIDDDFTTFTPVPTLKYFDENTEGNILKFLVDGDYIYYTLNSRLFRLENKDGEYVSNEIIIPHIKGSIVELSKVEHVDKDGKAIYKYVIASQTQIFIVSSLEVDQLEDYEFYDSSNGLKPIAANTSGFYDKDEQKYYFQSENGVFVYDFNVAKGTAVPVKIGISKVELDGEEFYGDTINIKKDVYRITINVSIFGFKPNKGYTVYYKLDGIDNNYHTIIGDDRDINYTNLRGGSFTFHMYAVDEYGQTSNHINIRLIKEKHIYEYIWFWIVAAVLALSLIVGIAFFIIRQKTKQALKKQLEYKNITVESIQAIARTIDAKDEYTNGHSTRVGYYSKLIAQNLGMSEDEVDNIYYIALLHDIGKIAIPDKILNKPGRLTDEEFAVMKSHTTRGAKILKGISTIPHIVEGAKYHHEKYDGTGYPERLKGEEIPYVARIICCADCFDAMASKRVYKEPFSPDTIISEFKRCSGTQFDPKIAEVVIHMMATGKLKPFAADNTYLGDDGKTHRIGNKNNEENH